jgi:type I restriction-modification system DNA methylase subunit
MTTQHYIDSVKKRFASGISREHSYRSDLETLIRTLVTDVHVTNEPANVTDCGNPDYVITKRNIPIGYIEAKDLGKDLNSKNYQEQFHRYKKALDNLIITDYLWFQFFQNGELAHEVRIAEIVNDKVVPLPENFSRFETLLQNFCSFQGQTIKSPKKLAEMMAARAKLLQDILEKALTADVENEEPTSLHGQFDTFKQILIHDLTPKSFADLYAQTLAYGMFAARLHDSTLDTFTRQEASELIPKSNPFLRKLFNYVAGPDIDERIKRTVDNLADVFRATNVEELLKSYGKSTHMQDPIIHFYETFLAEFDPKLRKARGVWYTPEPVVKFIVRAVDDILQTEFGLKDGLADTSKTTIKVDVQHKKTKGEQSIHKVQILDPALGTGTFLAEVMRHIHRKFAGMQGIWNDYVEKDLIPRLNGFELLMASYAMAHLKLDLVLRETGYTKDTDKRLNVFLTNSLEAAMSEAPNLFMAQWLTEEAKQADFVKKDKPVMVVLGNPPYSGESANKGEWIMGLMEDYKKEPGGKEKLKERNPKWINDDYVKFYAMGNILLKKMEVACWHTLTHMVF